LRLSAGGPKTKKLAIAISSREIRQVQVSASRQSSSEVNVENFLRRLRVQKRSLTATKDDFRYAPNNGHHQTDPACLKGAHERTWRATKPRQSSRWEQGIVVPRRQVAGVDAWAFCRHIPGMNKLRSAALTTTATAYGGSPSGRAR